MGEHEIFQFLRKIRTPKVYVHDLEEISTNNYLINVNKRWNFWWNLSTRPSSNLAGVTLMKESVWDKENNIEMAAVEVISLHNVNSFNTKRPWYVLYKASPYRCLLSVAEIFVGWLWSGDALSVKALNVLISILHFNNCIVFLHVNGLFQEDFKSNWWRLLDNWENFALRCYHVHRGKGV